MSYTQKHKFSNTA